MAYIKDGQELGDVTRDLIEDIKTFRAKAENRIMDKSEWNESHRIELKAVVDKMLDLQIMLNEL